MDSWLSEESMMKLSKLPGRGQDATARGKDVHCRLEDNNRITIRGEATIDAISEIVAEL